MATIARISVTSANNGKSFDVTDATGAYNATTNTGGYGSPNFTTGDVTAATVQVTAFGSTSTYSVNVYSTLPSSASASFTINNDDIGFEDDEVIADGIYLIRYNLTGKFNITAVSTGAGGSFTVSGNKSSVFSTGDTFTITGSTNNNATWTISAITYNSGPNTTTFTVTGTVGATADGQINFSTYTSVYQMFYTEVQSCLLEKLSELEVNDCAECMEDKLKRISKIDAFLSAARYAALCGKVNKADALLTYVTSLCDLEDCDTCN